MPGQLTDTIASPDYTAIRVSIVDITDDKEDEVQRWVLSTCGDGEWNTT
jgi:hypothetical protein